MLCVLSIGWLFRPESKCDIRVNTPFFNLFTFAPVGRAVVVWFSLRLLSLIQELVEVSHRCIYKYLRSWEHPLTYSPRFRCRFHPSFISPTLTHPFLSLSSHMPLAVLECFLCYLTRGERMRRFFPIGSHRLTPSPSRPRLGHYSHTLCSYRHQICGSKSNILCSDKRERERDSEFYVPTTRVISYPTELLIFILHVWLSLVSVILLSYVTYVKTDQGCPAGWDRARAYPAN